MTVITLRSIKNQHQSSLFQFYVIFAYLVCKKISFHNYIYSKILRIQKEATCFKYIVLFKFYQLSMRAKTSETKFKNRMKIPYKGFTNKN